MINSINIGIVCDLHIGHCPFDERKVSLREFLQLQYRSLLHQLDFFKCNHCTHIIFAGDTFDTPFPSQEMMAILLKAIKQYDFVYHFILGNHEIEGYKTKNNLKKVDLHALLSLKELEHFSEDINVHLDYTETELEGFPVTFLSWPLVHTKRNGLVIMHNELYGAKRDNGSRFEQGQASVLNIKDVKQNNQMFISGHLHSQQWLCKGDSYHGIYYPGRLGASRHDTGLFNKFCYVKMSKKDKLFNYEINIASAIPFWDVRRIKPNCLQDLKDLDDSPVDEKYRSYVIHRKDGSYVPDEEYLKNRLYIRVIEEIKPARELAHEIVGSPSSDNFMTRYTEEFVTGMRDRYLKSSLLRNRFQAIQNKINQEG